MEKLRIIVGGFLGILPAGGITWDYIQYPLGFSLLGHDVYYIEDTRLYPVYQHSGSDWDDCSFTVKHLEKVMNYFNLNNRWAYRDEASGKTFGLSMERIQEICRTADVFVNISCSTYMRDEYLQIPKRILIDSDPMFTQIQYLSQQMFTDGTPGLKQMIHQHNYLFSFGENIGNADCKIPLCDLTWQTTRQPICLDYWKPTPLPAGKEIVFSTLMNWSAAKKLIYENEEWGQKDIEFKKIITLPQIAKNIRFEIVVNNTLHSANGLNKELIEQHGWKILDPDNAAGDWMKYQEFIHAAAGEFSVAKETYVKAWTGWFSCRSACYLAAGRPVITQDTGWSKFITSGNGLFAFNTIEEATESLQKVCEKPVEHSRAAAEIARNYFDSNKVLTTLLEMVSN